MMKSKLDNYEKEFKNIKKQTNSTSTKQVMQKFEKKYEQNFE